MSCFFGHKWQYVYIFHYRDNTYGEHARSYKATRRCTKCGKVHTPDYGVYGGGWPTVDQLNGK